MIEGEWGKRGNYPNNEFTKVYYFEFKGDERDLKFNDGEVQKVKWMSISDVENSIYKKSEEWSGKLGNFVKNIDFLTKRLAL